MKETFIKIYFDFFTGKIIELFSFWYINDL